jgi:hypothetical protein
MISPPFHGIKTEITPIAFNNGAKTVKKESIIKTA